MQTAFSSATNGRNSCTDLINWLLSASYVC